MGFSIKDQGKSNDDGLIRGRAACEIEGDILAGVPGDLLPAPERSAWPVVKRRSLAALLAIVLMAMMTATVTPALAQTSGGDPPDYILEADGTVVIDGDVATDCPSFAVFVPDADENPDLEQAQRVLEQCEKAGFLDSEDGTPSAPVSTVDGGSETLPKTGGPALPVLLAVAVVASGLLAHKVAW